VGEHPNGAENAFTVCLYLFLGGKREQTPTCECIRCLFLYLCMVCLSFCKLH